MKKKCAYYASQKIQDGMVVGLGGGSTIGFLIDYVKEKDIKVVTPSMSTAIKCKAAGLSVLPAWMVDHIDIAFDGCDEVDEQCNALKSGGAIHTMEKIVASMADEYIVLIDESKYSKRLTFSLPVVVEVIHEAYSVVYRQLSMMGVVKNRVAVNKDGILKSDNGHDLMDVYFENVEDIEALNQRLLMMPGVVDTSLFVGVVSGILMVKENSVIEMKDGEWNVL